MRGITLARDGSPRARQHATRKSSLLWCEIRPIFQQAVVPGSRVLEQQAQTPPSPRPITAVNEATSQNNGVNDIVGPLPFRSSASEDKARGELLVRRPGYTGIGDTFAARPCMLGHNDETGERLRLANTATRPAFRRGRAARYIWPIGDLLRIAAPTVH